MNSWHEVRVSRTAKSGILQVDNQRPTEGKAEVRIALISYSPLSVPQKPALYSV